MGYTGVKTHLLNYTNHLLTSWDIQVVSPPQMDGFNPFDQKYQSNWIISQKIIGVFYTPRILTWQWNITISFRRYIFKWLVFHAHYQFSGVYIIHIKTTTLIIQLRVWLEDLFRELFIGPNRPLSQSRIWPSLHLLGVFLPPICTSIFGNICSQVYG